MPLRELEVGELGHQALASHTQRQSETLSMVGPKLGPPAPCIWKSSMAES
jgi:hypothetical protein